MQLYLTLEKYLANTRNWFSIDKKTITISKFGLLDFLKVFGYYIDGIKIDNKEEGTIVLLDLKAGRIEYNTAMCDTGIITEETIRSIRKAIKDYLVIPSTKIEVKTDCFENYYIVRLYINIFYEAKNKAYTVGLKKNVFEHLNENNSSVKIWYHGSDRPIKKFLFSMIGKNGGRISNYHGYGIYFVDDIERAKKYGDIITRVHIDKNSDFLVGKITRAQLEKVYTQLISENFKLTDIDIKWYKNPIYDKYSILNNVEEFYDYFLRRFRDKFENIQGVSEFLLRCGIDGMEVKNDIGDNILVVFNENVIDII